MAKTITITIPDDAYNSLERAAADAHQSPEDIASRAVTDRFGLDATQARDLVLAAMRANGHLAASTTLPTTVELPPEGSPEREQLEAEIAEELGDAFRRSGLSLLDLVERR